jgi:hypothetical protein
MITIFPLHPIMRILFSDCNKVGSKCYNWGKSWLEKSELNPNKKNRVKLVKNWVKPNRIETDRFELVSVRFWFFYFKIKTEPNRIKNDRSCWKVQKDGSILNPYSPWKPMLIQYPYYFQFPIYDVWVCNIVI